MSFLWTILIVSLLTNLGCRSSKSKVMSPPPVDSSLPQDIKIPATNTNSDTTSNLTPSLNIRTFSLGDNRYQIIVATQLEIGDFYQYEVCSLDTDYCEQGRFPFGTKFLAHIPAGRYRLELSSCLITDETSKTACSESVSETFVQPTLADPKLDKMLQNISKMNKIIGNYAPEIHTLLVDYWTTNPPENTPLSTVQQEISTLITSGPYMISTLLKSNDFQQLNASMSAMITQSNSDHPPENNQEPSDETPDRLSLEVLNLQEQIDALTAGLEQEEQVGVHRWAPTLLALGTISIVAGVITAIIGYGSEKLTNLVGRQVEKQQNSIKNFIDENIISETSKIVRHTLHQLPDGYQQHETSVDLEKRLEAENNKIDSKEAKHIKSQQDGYDIWKKNGELVYISKGHATYAKGSGLFKIIDTEDPSTLTKSQWNQLPINAQIDYEVDPNNPGTRIRKADKDIIGSYLTIDGATYKLSTTKTQDTFPDLNEETIIRFYNNQNKVLKEAAVGSKPADWKKGVLMIDTKGRLVQPPESWRVAGVNWFIDSENPTGKDFTIDGRKFEFKNIDDPKQVLKTNTFRVRSDENDGWFAKWAKNKAVTALDLENKVWETELSLKFIEYTGRKITTAAVPQTGSGLHSLQDQALKYSRIGRYGGAALILLGIGAAGAAITLGYELTGTNNLMTKLADINKHIAKLQLQRLQQVQYIETYLQKRGFTMPDDPAWITLL